MTPRQHAMLARLLIDACGGVDACCKPVTRVERSQLYAYRDADNPSCMPADVIFALESKCKNPVYSVFLYEAAQEASQAQAVASVKTAADDLHSSTFHLWEAARIALEDGELSETEKRQLEPLVLRLEEKTRIMRAAMDAARPDAGAPE